MARLPDAPTDLARIIAWAAQTKGVVERELSNMDRQKIAYPQGSRHSAWRTVALITATGTTQVTASLLAADLNEITSGTVGTGATITPSARPGMEIKAFNIGTAAMGIYPATGERIGTAGTNASITLGPGTGASFSCITAQRWQIMRGS